MEQYIKEGKNPIKSTRLSCRNFHDNAIRLQLHALAYNLAIFIRKLDLSKEIEHWPLTTLQEKMVEICAKVIRHCRYVVFQLTEVAVPKDPFRKILSPNNNLRPGPAPVQAGDIHGEVETAGEVRLNEDIIGRMGFWNWSNC